MLIYRVTQLFCDNHYLVVFSYMQKDKTAQKKKLILLPLSSFVLLVFKLGGQLVNLKCTLLHACIFILIAKKNRSIEDLQMELGVEKNILE